MARPSPRAEEVRYCGACGLPARDHPPGDEALCWEGRARMASARRAAGGDLSALDVEALRRCPDPPALTIHGYRNGG